MPGFTPSNFGPGLEPYLQRTELNSLGPGEPDGPPPDLDLASAFPDAEIVDEEMAQAVLAGVLLLHDHLDASHRLSQGIETPTGSYWHGIMHRREPDISNAHYWFRKVGVHPIEDDLCQRARDLALTADDASEEAAFLREQKVWNASAFLDLCGDAYGRGDAVEKLCQRIQRAEWELLFAFSYAHAVGHPQHRDDLV